MIVSVWLRYEPIMLEVILEPTGNKPCNVAMRVFDKTQAATVFVVMKKTIAQRESLFVRMPLSPNTVQVQAVNVDYGSNPVLRDTGFRIVYIKKHELQLTLAQTKMDTPMVRSFVRFAQRFAYNCGWYDVNRTYKSNMGGFSIEYLPFITKPNTNVRMSTPARVSTKTGLIQVSKEQFVLFTIPMRMAILLHEFSHYYLNTDVSNEVEADLNALTIYLGLGYPVKEAYSAFRETFIGYPSEQNKQRFKIINKFIRDYVDEYKLKHVFANGDEDNMQDV